MKFSDLVRFLGLTISLIILWQFRQIILLLFTAVVLSIALNASVRKLVRTFNLSRSMAVMITVCLVLVLAVIVLLLVAPLVISQFQQIIQLMPAGLENLYRQVDYLKSNPPLWVPESALETLELPNFSDLIQQILSIGINVFGGFFNFFSSSLAIVLELLLVFVLTLMLLADPLAYRQLLLKLVPSSHKRLADRIFSKCEIALLQVLGAILLKSLFVAALSFFGLLLLGVDFAFTHAVIAGMFNFIPNIGPLLSTVFPLSVALLGSWGQSILVIVLYVIIQNVESYWLGPVIMQRQVSLLPAATLIAQLFFATFLGPLGLLLSIPLAVITKTCIEEAWLKDVIN